MSLCPQMNLLNPRSGQVAEKLPSFARAIQELHPSQNSPKYCHPQEACQRQFNSNLVWL